MKVPAPLKLPPGKLFFGFPVVPYQPKTKPAAEESSSSFSGTGNTLSSKTLSPPSSRKGKEKAKEETQPAKDWGTGQTLGSRRSAPTSQPKVKPQRQRSPTPDWGVDDDDVIIIDSD